MATTRLSSTTAIRGRQACPGTETDSHRDGRRALRTNHIETKRQRNSRLGSASESRRTRRNMCAAADGVNGRTHLRAGNGPGRMRVSTPSPPTIRFTVPADDQIVTTIVLSESSITVDGAGSATGHMPRSAAASGADVGPHLDADALEIFACDSYGVLQLTQASDPFTEYVAVAGTEAFDPEGSGPVAGCSTSGGLITGSETPRLRVGV
jgi:hypothetical protein